MSKVALITGVTGQDGSYLSRLLLSKGYTVHGLKRRSSLLNTQRLDDIYQDPHEKSVDLILHYGDLTDTTNLVKIINDIKPDEIYNLAAQSHVKVSFETAEYTANADALGTLRLLEALRILKSDCKFYQASTSELYGKVINDIQDESTVFMPRSPYAVAKLYAYWITVNYREAYNLYASNGILFNHESPLRGETFVTQKISNGVAKIELGQLDVLHLGNLDAVRDWGHAKDYVRGMWLMLQHSEPDDFVLATGKGVKVRQFVEMAFSKVAKEIVWEGNGLDEVGKDSKTGKILIKIDPRYFRPTEVNHLTGNAEKAKKLLGWKPEISLDEMIEEMVRVSLHNASQPKPNFILADF